MLLIDMHVHTKEGSICSKVSAENTIKILKQKNINGCIFTDHESIRGYLTVFKDKELLKDFILICGIEYTTDYGDFLIILPNISDYSKLTQTYIGEPEILIDKVHRLDGVVGIAHPFRDGYSSFALTDIQYERYNNICNMVDFIEVKNGSASDDENFNACLIANEYFKFGSCGSDSHIDSYVGKCFRIFHSDEINQTNIIKYILDYKNEKI